MRAWHLREGDCIEELKKVKSGLVDAIVTDPPAGIEFMGKAWDSFSAKEGTALGRQEDAWGEFGNPYARGGTPRYTGKAKASLLPFQDFICDVFTEVYRVLKPGGHALVWAIPRTAHHTAMGLERAGFEIRDVVLHLFGTGFPKSLDVSKAIDATLTYGRADSVGLRQRDGRELGNVGTNTHGHRSGKTHTDAEGVSPILAPEAAAWEGWGTALKPAAEHWILARKPLDGTVANCVIKHGTGALNIDGCRIGTGKDKIGGGCAGVSALHEGGITRRTPVDFSKGRWPANVTLDEKAARALDEQSGERTSGKKVGGGYARAAGVHGGGQRGDGATCYGDSGGASRFFYVAKASRAEKDAGLDHLPVNSGGAATGRKDGAAGLANPRAGAGRTGTARNTHPTVKSVALMRWLVRLITPPGGLVLDPFMGSGSTGVAALAEGCRFLGIERDREFAEIARARLRSAE